MPRAAGRIAGVLAFAVAAIAFTATTTASAQRGRRSAPPPPHEDAPKGDAKPDDEDDHPSLLRSEPTINPPADPLVISPETRARIGSDSTGAPPAPEGQSHQQWLPYYENRRGDSRLRLLPPLFVEQTRGLRDPSQELYGVPKTEDTQGLYGLLYYRRRSLQLDMDVVFPAFWRVRDHENNVVVLGPFAHREAPGENDNWLAPLYFQGSRKDGGYFHAPLLLTSTHWSPSGAFTLVGPYFRNRTGPDVSLGVAPVYFHGDNGDVQGNHRTYTFIPPLFYYHNEHELEGSSFTLAGPVISASDPKRDTFDIAPFYFHTRGKPESGGVAEEHTTLLPFFHYGHDPNQSLLVLPGYYRHVTRTSDAMLTPFVSHVEGRSGATSLTAVGPLVPLWWDYRDRDLASHAWAAAPFFYTSDSPQGHDWLTPLLGRFETYGQSTTWWVFPSLTVSTNTHGWENDLHPLVYVGRHDDSSHTVVAPVFWDFADKGGRSTVAFPVYWRFADTKDDSVTQVAANTLYMQKRVAGGLDWQFHLLPFFSYGENPGGYFWNVLFGLAGYTRQGTSAVVRALWVPIETGTAPPPVQQAAGR